jgi:hypothetical protein
VTVPYFLKMPRLLGQNAPINLLRLIQSPRPMVLLGQIESLLEGELGHERVWVISRWAIRHELSGLTFEKRYSDVPFSLLVGYCPKSSGPLLHEQGLSRRVPILDLHSGQFGLSRFNGAFCPQRPIDLDLVESRESL